MNWDTIEDAQDAALSDLDDGWAPPVHLPPGWVRVTTMVDGAQYINVWSAGSLIVTRARELDGRRWVHISLAHPTHLPRWRELVTVRDWVLGPEAKAIQVIPPATEHVNLHPFALHIFHCLDEDPLPDFTHGTGSL